MSEIQTDNKEKPAKFMKYGERVKVKSGFYEGLEGYLLHEGDEKDNYLIAMDISELGVIRFTIDNIETLAGNSPNSNDNNKNYTN